MTTVIRTALFVGTAALLATSVTFGATPFNLDISGVPEPNPCWLLGLGLTGLVLNGVGFYRRAF